MFQLLSQIAPQLGVKFIDPNDISSIPEEVEIYNVVYSSLVFLEMQVERYVNDPLVWHGGLKVRWGVAIVASITLFRENINRLSLPMLIIHGSEDKLVPISSSHFINDNAPSPDKKFEVRTVGPVQALYGHLLCNPSSVFSCMCSVCVSAC